VKMDQFGVVDLGALVLDLDIVAGIATEVSTVASLEAAIGIVNGNAADIATVAGISADVTTVAVIAADVTTVAADGTDIGVVAGLSTQITTLSPISADITTVAGIAANVTSVAGNATNINTVAGISADVTTVAVIAADVTTVAGISADVTQVAADTIPINAAAANAAAAAAAAGAAFTSETNAFTSETNAAASAAAALASETAAALSEANIDLGAIAQTITATTVDTLVYDTSKDSDGGAWRKRTQNRSWYQELGEFPSVALIVATTSSITIYDADDPALPVYCTFTGSSTNMLFYTATTAEVTSLAMLNGELCAGLNKALGGVNRINFLKDTSIYEIDAGGFFTHNGPIGQRNDGLGVTQTSGARLVNREVNDVSMTVEAGAPIDAATGLAVPTVAAATSGGLSVINNDGTVTDSAATGTVIKVTVAESGFWYSEFSGSRLYYTTFADALAGDGFGDKFGDTDGTADFNSVTTTENMDYNSGILSAGGSPTLGDFELSVNGLMLHQPNYADQTAGMSALITDEFNTGWMQGDIKGAFLSSTDTASLVGGDLVTNGDNEAAVVSNAASNMTKVQSSDFAQSGSFSAKYTASGGNTFHYAFNQAIAADEYVRLRYWVYIPLAYAGAGVGHVDVFDGSFLSALENTRDTWVFVEDFREPKGTEWQVAIGNANSENIDGEIFYLDNISVETGVDLDRSVNSNSLQVNGTITRTAVATGAELVAYSGWSAANYLEQPYNADLDFGTGDFCFMGWLKTTSAAANNILHRALSGNTGGALFSLTSAGFMEIYLSANTTFANKLIGTIPLNTGVYTHFVARRLGGVLSIFINGVLDNSVANVTNITYASTLAKIGARHDSTAFFDGSLALLRIGAAAPTAAQINKSYEDEKYLFQENADAVLTNSTVTALGFDPDTNLLHVGGNVGRDEFQGLRRTATTTGAVTSAISVGNKLSATGRATTVDVAQPAISLRDVLNALRQTAV